MPKPWQHCRPRQHLRKRQMRVRSYFKPPGVSTSMKRGTGVTTSVRGACQALPGLLRLFAAGALAWVFVLRAGAVAGPAGPAVRGGLAAGTGNIRAEAMVSHGAVRVPVTRVFSLYVVQAGSACPRMRAGMPRQRSTELVRSSGRPGESCPGFPAGLIPGDLAGSLSPSCGRKVLGTRGGCGRDGGAGQAASAGRRGARWHASPEAIAASQLVP